MICYDEVAPRVSDLAPALSAKQTDDRVGKVRRLVSYNKVLP